MCAWCEENLEGTTSSGTSGAQFGHTRSAVVRIRLTAICTQKRERNTSISCSMQFEFEYPLLTMLLQFRFCFVLFGHYLNARNPIAGLSAPNSVLTYSMVQDII
jgi:hypothetical protein